MPYKGNLETFRNDWIEVEFPEKVNEASYTTPKIPEFLQATMSRFEAR